jgi:high-affinity iron transporter
VITGLVLSILLTVALYYSLVKIKLQTIFNVTLAYLVLQAGFLLGYSVHEALSAAKELGMITSENPIFTKAFNLSETVFYHKEGIIGLPLYVTVGWYSKPEWIQFILQYILTFSLLGYWFQRNKKEKKVLLSA